MVCSLLITATLVVPASAGALKPLEFIIFGIWIAIGIVNWVITTKLRNEISKDDRTFMILGKDIKNDLENAIENNDDAEKKAV